MGEERLFCCKSCKSDMCKAQRRAFLRRICQSDFFPAADDVKSGEIVSYDVVVDWRGRGSGEFGDSIKSF